MEKCSRNDADRLTEGKYGEERRKRIVSGDREGEGERGSQPVDVHTRKDAISDAMMEEEEQVLDRQKTEKEKEVRRCRKADRTTKWKRRGVTEREREREMRSGEGRREE